MIYDEIIDFYYNLNWKLISFQIFGHRRLNQNLFLQL